MSSQFHKLKVVAIDYPIEEATTITLEVPENLYESFNYFPGQHLVIKLTVDGQEARRSYSLNSNPFKAENLQITVKRVKGGLVSNYVGDKLQVGDELEVMEPQGRFYADVKEDAYKTYFLFAAGSGITPIISILKAVLLAAPDSMVNLFYGNKHQESIIFKEELDRLLEKYPERLQIAYTLSEPKVWTTWEQWKGRKGRIDTKAVEWFITNYPPVAQNTMYYICGPGAMNTSVRDALIGLQIPKELIHIEQFAGEVAMPSTSIEASDNAQLTATLNGKKHQTRIPKGKTILQALQTLNIDPPYSCESGVCATCVAKVVKGKAAMKTCMALEDEEVANGMILTCQALPITENIEIVYQ